MTSPAIQLARECGATGELVGEMPEWDFLEVQLETFYAKAQAQALRDAAKDLDGLEADYLNALADELEKLHV